MFTKGLQIYIDSQIGLTLAGNFLDLWVWDVEYMGAVWNDNNLRSPPLKFCKWLFSTQPEPSKGGVHKCFKLVYLARGLEIYIDSQIWLPLAVNFLVLWVWEVEYMETIWNDNDLRSPPLRFLWIFIFHLIWAKQGDDDKCFKLV